MYDSGSAGRWMTRSGRPQSARSPAHCGSARWRDRGHRHREALKGAAGQVLDLTPSLARREPRRRPVTVWRPFPSDGARPGPWSVPLGSRSRSKGQTDRVARGPLLLPRSALDLVHQHAQGQVVLFGWEVVHGCGGGHSVPAHGRGPSLPGNVLAYRVISRAAADLSRGLRLLLDDDPDALPRPRATLTPTAPGLDSPHPNGHLFPMALSSRTGGGRRHLLRWSLLSTPFPLKGVGGRSCPRGRLYGRDDRP